MILKVFLPVILVVILIHILFFSCMMKHGTTSSGETVTQEINLSQDSRKPVFSSDDPIPPAPVADGSGHSPMLPSASPQPSAFQDASFPNDVLIDGFYVSALADMPAKLAQDTSKCKAGICIDLTNRKILWEKNSATPLPIASMTKMMTVYLFMKQLKQPGSSIALDTVVPATPEACKIGGHQIWMDPKETFTLEELLKCIMIRSANDCAYLLGSYLAGGNEAIFVQRMNDEARSLGLQSFVFRNSHGLYSFAADGKTRLENMGCALELAHLAGLLMRIPEVTKWSSTKHDCIRENSSNPKFKKFDLDSTNTLLNNASCPGVNGMKTGMTNGAGHCITATCERNNRQLVVVVMGCPTGKERDSLVKQIINWAYTK